MYCCNREKDIIEKRGPRGPRGYEGREGPTGPTGESGTRVYGYFVSTTSPYNSGSFDMYKFKSQGTGTTQSNYTSGLELTDVIGTFNGSVVQLTNPGNYKVSYNIYLNPHGETGDSGPLQERTYLVKLSTLLTPPITDDVYIHSFKYFAIPLPQPENGINYGSAITLVGEFIHSYSGGENIGLTIACDDIPVFSFSDITATLIIEKLS